MHRWSSPFFFLFKKNPNLKDCRRRKEMKTVWRTGPDIESDIVSITNQTTIWDVVQSTLFFGSSIFLMAPVLEILSRTRLLLLLLLGWSRRRMALFLSVFLFCVFLTLSYSSCLISWVALRPICYKLRRLSLVTKNSSSSNSIKHNTRQIEISSSQNGLSSSSTSSSSSSWENPDVPCATRLSIYNKNSERQTCSCCCCYLAPSPAPFSPFCFLYLFRNSFLGDNRRETDGEEVKLSKWQQ